jgi:peptidase E
MTKYIVQSGGLGNSPEKATSFFSEIIKGQGNKPKILLCFFAEKRGHWEDRVDEYIKGFCEKISEDISPEFKLALPDVFEKQIKWANAVYIFGGDDELLILRLKNFDLEKLWDGKTVATISAGSDMLSKSFWTCDWRKCMDGFGILPIKIIPHYNSGYGSDDPRGPVDWKNAYNELKEHGDTNLPIYALEEGDFVVFEK